MSANKQTQGTGLSNSTGQCI